MLGTPPPPGTSRTGSATTGAFSCKPVSPTPVTDPGDYGGYSSPATNSTISKALAAESASVAAGLWAQAQRQIINDAATVPLDYLTWPIYHSSALHGCNFWWVSFNCDPTNVWLSS